MLAAAVREDSLQQIMSKNRSVECWVPAKSLKRPNHIQSSDYTNWKPFVSSFEEEKRPCIGLLLSMEYGRVWRQELEAMFRDTKKECEVLPVRPYIIRGLNQKKQIWENKKPPLFRMKQFQNIPARTDCWRKEI